MFQEIGDGPTRTYQVRIKDEYLEDLYQFDAGSVEQEVFARAQEGMICVVTDRPETIFARLGDAVKAVTYMGPKIDLPEWLEGHANYCVTQRNSKKAESEDREWKHDLYGEIRTYPARVMAFMTRAGVFAAVPFVNLSLLLARWARPIRTARFTRAGQKNH